jgi:dTDP-4-dehydrorhamnose reductase
VTAAMRATLVLGGTGFVGREIVQAFQCRSASLSGQGGSLQCDATDERSLAGLLDREDPKTVVNCVGLADVDAAENDEAKATLLNATVVTNLATQQARRGFRLVHISTDYVFDGATGGYREEDRPNPVNIYGRTKLLGEGIARKVPHALILRISSPYGKSFGARKVQFFRYVVDSLRAGKRVRALTDQRITPTYLPDLSRAVEHLVTNQDEGLFHIGSSRPWSRYDFAVEIARIAGLDPIQIDPAMIAEMTNWVAKRPADTSLNVEKSMRAGVTYTPVPEALSELLEGTVRSSTPI